MGIPIIGVTLVSLSVAQSNSFHHESNRVESSRGNPSMGVQVEPIRVDNAGTRSPHE